ncbi:hypothetical protein LJR027_003672 [Terrabacter sp. LjRoot27]|uniref:RNA polymerase sigma factor n=1 Tax=Terrabacter sp. LjRoot27 TaxID=3342306 RepID=UPI003ECF8621
MAGTTPARPTSESLALREAFDRHYADLVAELTALSGSTGTAEAAVDEAFRRAAAMPDFAEVGRAHDWLRVTARNQVVRRSFRHDDLDGLPATPAAAHFERPSLAGSLARARRAHRADLVRRAALGAAGTALAVTAVVAVAGLSPWSNSSAPAGTAASSPGAVASSGWTGTWSSPPLIPTTDAPVPSPSVSQPWPPGPEQVVGHPAATKAYVVQSPQAADRRATVWERCRPAEPNQYPACEGDDIARAVEVVDGRGHRIVRRLGDQEVVRPAFDGTFAVLPAWGSDGHALLSPTMTEPKPFEVEPGVRPRPGQVFTQCGSGPCLVDLHGTVRLLDLPAAADIGWDQQTSSGWLGVQTVEATGATRVFIQQADGTFSTVDVRLTVPRGEGDSPNATSWPGGRVAIWASTRSGFSQVAVSSDRGRSWTVRWGSPDSVGDPASFGSAPLATSPGLAISQLRRWPPNG